MRYVTEGSIEDAKGEYITIGRLKAQLGSKRHWANAFAKSEDFGALWLLLKHQFMRAASDSQGADTDSIRIDAFKLKCLGIIYCHGTAN